MITGYIRRRNHARAMGQAMGLMMASILLLLSHNTISAFVPRSVPVRATYLQKSNLSAVADPPSSPPASPSSSTSPGAPFRLQRIDHVVIRCKNFPAMFDFYHRVLGCTIDEPIADHFNRFGGALTHLRAGSCYIDLLAYDTNHLSEEGKAAAARMHAGGVGLGEDKSLEDVNLSSETSSLDHLCLRIDPYNEQDLLKYLDEENVNIVVAGDRRLGADGVGPSVYVRDPEGNVIELKGNPYNENSKIDKDEDDAKKSPSESIVETETSTVTIDTVPKGEELESKSGTKQSSTDTHEDSPSTQSITNNSNPSDVPLTPCNRICRYNSSFCDGQVCIGCFREAYEIEMWQSMTPVQKSMTLLDAADRCSENQQALDGAITVEELTRQYEYWSDVAKR